MLDNASDLQLVLLTLVLMALFSYGGVRVRARWNRTRERRARIVSLVARIAADQRAPAVKGAAGGEDRRPLTDRVAADVRARVTASEYCGTTRLTLNPPKDVA